MAGLVLLVLRNFHTHPFRQRTDGIGVAQALDLHLEIDDTAALVAAEAVIDALIGCNRERGRLLSMEWAKSKQIGAGTFQRHVLPHNIFNGIAGSQFINKCRWESHDSSSFR